MKTKFQPEVSENKAATFCPSKFKDPLKSIHGPPRGPQVKNGWFITHQLQI